MIQKKYKASTRKGDSVPTEIAQLKKQFAWFIGPLKSVRRSPAAFLHEPATYMARVRAKMHRAISKRVNEVGQEAFARELVGLNVPRAMLLEGFARVRDGLHDEEREISKLAAGAGLLALIRAADARVRNSPFVLSFNLQLLLGQSVIPSLAQLRAARRYRGERGSRMLLRTIAEASEAVYHPYLREVWNLTEVVAGRVPKRPPGYGSLVKELTTRVGGIANVVNPTALYVRNAVDHDLYEYDPGKRCAVLRTDRPQWRAEMSYDDLSDLADEIVGVAGTTFRRAVSWFQRSAMLQAGLFAPLLAFPPALRENDRAALERIGCEIDVRTRDMFKDIAELFAAGVDCEHLREVADRG